MVLEVPQRPLKLMVVFGETEAQRRRDNGLAQVMQQGRSRAGTGTAGSPRPFRSRSLAGNGVHPPKLPPELGFKVFSNPTEEAELPLCLPPSSRQKEAKIGPSGSGQP